MTYSGEHGAMKNSNGPPISQEDLAFVWSVYRRHKGIIYRTAYASMAEGMEPDEIVNESILVLARYAGRLRRLDEKPLAVYIAGVVRTVALSMARSDRRYAHRVGEGLQAYEDTAAGPGAEEAYIERETRAMRAVWLREALDELSEDDRALLTLKYLKNVGDREMAELLGLRPGTLRMRLTRARRRAKDIIRRKEEESDASTEAHKQGI